MSYKNQQRTTSADTSVNVVNRIYTNYNFLKGSRILDYGGGKYNSNVDYMKEKGCNVLVYDPFNRSKELNDLTMSKSDYDTATLSNVLNVIKEKEIRLECLKDIKRHLKPNGILYISIYEGDKSEAGKSTRKSCWQNNMKLKSYLSEVKQVFDSVEISRGYIKAV